MGAVVEMKLKAHAIITAVLDRDIRASLRAVFEHDDEPSPEHIAEMVYNRVMLGLNEIIDWEEDDLEK